MAENKNSQEDSVSPFVIFIHGTVDGRVYSPSPVDMQIIAFCSLKSEYNNLEYKIIPTNPNNPPESFKKLQAQSKFPTFSNDYHTFQNIEDIFEYFDYYFPNPKLSYSVDHLAAKGTKDLLIKFCHFIKNYPQISLEKLIGQFENLENILKNSKTQFLTSNHLTLLDIEVVFKLYHIVVCMKIFLNVKILERFPQTANYLAQGLSHNGLDRICSTNSGIYSFWKDKVSPQLNCVGLTSKYLNDEEKMVELEDYLS